MFGGALYIGAIRMDGAKGINSVLTAVNGNGKFVDLVLLMRIGRDVQYKAFVDSVAVEDREKSVKCSVAPRIKRVVCFQLGKGFGCEGIGKAMGVRVNSHRILRPLRSLLQAGRGRRYRGLRSPFL